MPTTMPAWFFTSDRFMEMLDNSMDDIMSIDGDAYPLDLAAARGRARGIAESYAMVHQPLTDPAKALADIREAAYHRWCLRSGEPTD